MWRDARAFGSVSVRGGQRRRLGFRLGCKTSRGKQHGRRRFGIEKCVTINTGLKLRRAMAVRPERNLVPCTTPLEDDIQVRRCPGQSDFHIDVFRDFTCREIIQFNHSQSADEIFFVTRPPFSTPWGQRPFVLCRAVIESVSFQNPSFSADGARNYADRRAVKSSKT